MSQAIADPAELRRFAHNLKRFSGDLENQLSSLRSQLLTLGQTWRDREHDKFVEEFEETMVAINRFLEASGQHIPLLLRKAERIDEYLRQK